MIALPDRPSTVTTGGSRDYRDATAGVVGAAALLLVRCSDRGWVRLLAEHAADATGHCAGCSSTALGRPRWPCSLWSIARRAEWLAEQGAAGS
ncbi:MAG: hypothetical protein M3Z25_07850 [Actinomycetota bacterium]|nr:hypothetical protein [Actinomycetota bacterium]